MARRERPALPAKVKEIGDRIERWRRTRKKKRSPMPERLWREAAVFARSHGVYRISQALGVRFETLRNWAEKAVPLKVKPDNTSARFVEVALPGPTVQAVGPVVELEGEGQKLTIRLPAHNTVDVAELLNAWWSQRR